MASLSWLVQNVYASVDRRSLCPGVLKFQVPPLYLELSLSNPRMEELDIQTLDLVSIVSYDNFDTDLPRALGNKFLAWMISENHREHDPSVDHSAPPGT